MAEIIPLVLAPTDAQEVQQSVVRILETTLGYAKEGKIDSIIMLVSHGNDEWYPVVSESMCFSRDIGRIEILKQQWIRDVLAGNGL